MDIELQLREHLVLQDPGTPFTDGVMSRLGDAPQGPREGIVRLADVRARRRNRRILLGVLLTGVAAAMLALLLGRDGDETAVRIAAVPQPAAVLPAAVIPAQPPMIEPPATAGPPSAAAPAAPPAAPPASTFTVRVRPLANPDNLVDGVAIAQKFRDRLIARLQAIPNLVLVDPADGGSAADFEVRLRLENPAGIVSSVLGDAASAMRMVLVDAGPPSRFAAMDARLAAEAQMSPAEQQRSQRARQLQSARRRATALVGNGLPMSVGFLDQSMLPSPSGGDGLAEHRAEEVVRTLRNDIFPVDAAYKKGALARLRNPSESFAVRSSALSDLLRIAHRDGEPRLDAEVIRAGADLALSDLAPTDAASALPALAPALRGIVWENMLETRHPELVPQIARALDIEPDTDLRLRLIKILAGEYASDPAATKVLEVASRTNGQQLVRMAALRETQGEAKWQAYVAASLVDTSLPDLQRLQPIADMGNPGQQQATVRLALDDKALRELITLAGKVADSGNSTQSMNAIMALRFVDSPALADRLIEIMRAPVAESTPVKSLNSMILKMAANGVASVRFPDDPRFRASLKELSASPDPQLSDWAKEELQVMDAQNNPAARKALLDKWMKDILPK